MIDPARVLVPRRDLVIESFDDALLVWDEVARLLHHFDLRAAIVWEELDGRAAGQIADVLAREFGDESGSVRADVLTMCELLITQGLVRECGE